MINVFCILAPSLSVSSRNYRRNALSSAKEVSCPSTALDVLTLLVPSVQGRKMFVNELEAAGEGRALIVPHISSTSLKTNYSEY
jgi:hypothetical protein